MGCEFIFVVHGVIFLKLVDFPLHGFIVLFLRDMTPNSRMAFVCVRNVCTTLLISPTLKVDERILTLRCYGFCLM